MSLKIESKYKKTLQEKTDENLREPILFLKIVADEKA